MIIKFVKEAWFVGQKMHPGEIINTVCTNCALEAIKKGEAVKCKPEEPIKKSE